MTHSRRLDETLSRLAAAEGQFLQCDFLAPMPPGGRVQVRIAGVVCTLRVMPARFRGWGVFRPESHTAARLVRPATLTERQRYLELFPAVRLTLCGRAGASWLALPAHPGGRVRGPVPVYFVEEAELFAGIQGRFDGVQAWHEGPDLRGDPAAASYLRLALQANTAPEKLERPGLTVGHRAAYAFAHTARLEAERDRVEDRLRDALAHAGAELVGYSERDDCYRVEFSVDGQQQVSAVAKGDLSVRVAGICLSGRDAQFDLQSLVSVVREGQGHVLRIGADNAGMAEEDYWRVHPPEPADG